MAGATPPQARPTGPRRGNAPAVAWVAEATTPQARGTGARRGNAPIVARVAGAPPPQASFLAGATDPRSARYGNVLRCTAGWQSNRGLAISSAGTSGAHAYRAKTME